MSAFLRRWWPVLPALLLAWFGGASFVEKYPSPAAGQGRRAVAARAPDSLLEGIKLQMDRTAKSRDTAASPIENPFRPIRSHAPAGPRPGGMVLPPPPRAFRLNGTVGSDVATITNNFGQKVILKVGDAVDSAVVISIEPNKVILRDRAGTFELLPER